MIFDNSVKESPFLGFAGFGGGISWDAIQKYLDTVYVDDVFSTYLWEGTGSTQTITNGIDLAGEGGMIWTKGREVVENHMVHDSVRGKTGSYYDALQTNVTNADYTDAPYGPTSFNSDGFTLGGNNAQFNGSGDGGYCSWTFRKASGFFDVVTYTGNGTAGLTIPHSLGSVPGCIFVKNVSRAGTDWRVWHRDLTSNSYTLLLNSTNGEIDSGTGSWNNTAPTSTNFTVGGDNDVNFNGDTHVAYIFAHDDQSFGTDEDEAIIKCGSLTTGAGGVAEVNLGWEPQWLLVKTTTEVGAWNLTDNMRGFVTYGTTGTQSLNPNSSDAEGGISNWGPTSTGFKISYGGTSGIGLIYMAIRRPHKPPTTGTEVFDVVTASSYASGSDIPCGFAPDFMIATARTASLTNYAESRLTDNWLDTSNTNAENTTNYFKWDGSGGKINLPTSGFNDTPVFWQFRRAPGFFDVVTWSGDDTSNRAISHNLTVTPELLITKRRTTNFDGWWSQYTGIFGTNTGIRLDQISGLTTGVSAFSGTSAATSSAFYVGSDSSINASSNDYIAFLFATLPGISKVGSYTGTGGSFNVDCGFTAGARFVLIKRTDGDGNWRVYDTARGIVAGNDPYLHLNNSTDVEVTNNDGIDPYNQGFSITGSANFDINAVGGNYIFLAIA